MLLGALLVNLDDKTLCLACRESYEIANLRDSAEEATPDGTIEGTIEVKHALL